MGMISAFYKIESVFLAVGITAFVCLGVTIFSFQTKYDFTSCIGVMFVVSLALMGFGIVCLISGSPVGSNEEIVSLRIILPSALDHVQSVCWSRRSCVLNRKCR